MHTMFAMARSPDLHLAPSGIASTTTMTLAAVQVLCEALAWITQAVDEFGVVPLTVPSLLAWAKSDLGSAHAGSRAAAARLLGAMHAHVGPALGDLVRPDVKPALMAVVQAEFAARPKHEAGSFEPTRVSRCALMVTF